MKKQGVATLLTTLRLLRLHLGNTTDFREIPQLKEYWMESLLFSDHIDLFLDPFFLSSNKNKTTKKKTREDEEEVQKRKKNH
ncbi:Transcription factor AP-2-alpha [Manis javanica]|nr:Transcription factor AP-2-alpha [Manis javanica]